MRQLVILSGKGGTGKTTVASSFIKLATAKTYADCDVDAPNLHLIGSPFPSVKQTDYFSMPKAVINANLCISCAMCRKYCRFGAIVKDKTYKVDAASCEGCGVCAFVCPAKAITMEKTKAGDLLLYSDTDNTVFSTAVLSMGSGATGLLVTQVKKQMKAASGETPLAIIDGSPGIGCPVIASLSGADMVLIVAEPSISGISDMERIIGTAQQFQVRLAVCINKYDTNLLQSSHIESYCRTRRIPFVGKIPFEPMAIKAINQGKYLVDFPCEGAKALADVFAETMDLLQAEVV
ncbi:MAG: ATP-binding protein [Sphaerochaetaceae bacterium]